MSLTSWNLSRFSHKHNWGSEARLLLTSLNWDFGIIIYVNKIYKYYIIHGHVQRGQCMSKPGSYLVTTSYSDSQNSI